MATMLIDKCTDKCVEGVVHCFGILLKLGPVDNLSQIGNRIHSAMAGEV